MSPSRSAGPFLLFNPSFGGICHPWPSQMSDGQNERRKRKICLETAGNGKGERRKGWRLAGRQRHIGLGRRQNNKGRRRGRGIARSEKATANILGGGEMDAGKKGQPVVPAGIHSPGCPVPHFAPKGIDCPIRLPPLPLFYPHNIFTPQIWGGGHFLVLPPTLLPHVIGLLSALLFSSFLMCTTGFDEMMNKCMKRNKG
jgi:hypothetical protein